MSEQRIKALMATLEAVEHEVAIVYDTLTGGKFSKCNTVAQYVIDAVDERHEIELAAKDKRIKELEEDVSAFGHGLIELGVDESAHIVTRKQINEAWEFVMEDQTGYVASAIAKLGIVAADNERGWEIRHD